MIMACKYLGLLLLTTIIPSLISVPESDTLLKFRDSLSNSTSINNWDNSTAPCSGDNSNWIGVICSSSSVAGLQLENMSLTGMINVDSLLDLPNLRSISFMNNGFDGPTPDLKKLRALKAVFLSKNQFSGEIADDAFSGMKMLKKVYLAENRFSGRIPSSLAALPRLLEVQLEGNRFEGRIPEFQQKDLKLVNLANNNLQGPIPAILSNMDSTSFLGNANLCGKPLQPCSKSYADADIGPENESKSSKKLSTPAIVAIVVGAVAFVTVAFCFLVICQRQGSAPKPRSAKISKKSTTADEVDQSTEQYHGNLKTGGGGSGSGGGHGSGRESGKLSFLRNEWERFDLQDLLRASAEVLGSGSFGSSYKAVLLGGTTMVVKRFRQMNGAGRREFDEHMRRLGSLSHPNLLPLVAFYYTKEEKLLVSDYVEKGSLATHLHGHQSPGQRGLDWPTRLKIIKGVAKGLGYLHKEFPKLTLPHGHLKSSNVLLDNTFEPLLVDYGLAQLMNKEHAQHLMVAYKSPEFTQSNRTTRKSDVWSLGILMLELLTGKFPTNYLRQGNGAGADLGSWVNSVVREEWTGEVFDKEMTGRTRNNEGEMLKLLQIALGCCEWNVEKRWDLWKALEKIEELSEKGSDDADEAYYSSYVSEGDGYSSRTMTEDDFSFSHNNYSHN